MNPFGAKIYVNCSFQLLLYVTVPRDRQVNRYEYTECKYMADHSDGIGRVAIKTINASVLCKYFALALTDFGLLQMFKKFLKLSQESSQKVVKDALSDDHQ